MQRPDVQWVEVLDEPCELFSCADREGRPASAVRDRGCEASTLVVAGGFVCGPLGLGGCDDEIIRPSYDFAVGSFTIGCQKVFETNPGGTVGFGRGCS